ncbi:hypothetical protein [Prescottella subtropica]|uniref:hypothetical protein n=1 Tax=Prescottella subtropica TaxID=2545757 RepID=UPI001F4F57E8|nr:hypothetical protein [Prescottella subtropica]
MVSAVAERSGVYDVFLLALDVQGIPADPDAGGEPVPRLFLPASRCDRASVTLRADPVAVRVSVTGADLTLESGSTAVYVGPEGQCLSLWTVPGQGAVLACESWAEEPVAGVVDWDHDRIGALVDRFLAPFGLSVTDRLCDVFPDADPPLPTVSVAESFADTGHERSCAGLAIGVCADGGRQVRRRIEDAGTDGAGWCWDGVLLASSPARSGAGVAVREDAGAIVFDIEAVAAEHDHDVFGVTEMIGALVPWVAVRARHAMDYRLVLDHLRAPDPLDDGRLIDALNDVESVQARRMERILLVTEARHDGVAATRMSPAQLRTLLVRRLSAEMDVLDRELGEATRAIERALLRSAEQRGSRHSRLAQAWTVAAGAIAVVAVFAALASIPAVDEPTMFGHWLEALAATIVITVGVVAVVALWRRPSTPRGWQDREHGTHVESRR